MFVLVLVCCFAVKEVEVGAWERVVPASGRPHEGERERGDRRVASRIDRACQPGLTGRTGQSHFIGFGFEPSLRIVASLCSVLSQYIIVKTFREVRAEWATAIVARGSCFARGTQVGRAEGTGPHHPHPLLQMRNRLKDEKGTVLDEGGTRRSVGHVVRVS